MNLMYVSYPKHKRKIKEIYLGSFPKNERFPYSILKYTAKEKNVVLNSVVDKDGIIGTYYIVRCDDLYYLMYFAIDKEFRNKGYGSRVLNDLKMKYKNIFLSIEKKDDELAIRRKNFYLRNGFCETGKYYLDNGVMYEVLCTNNNFEITSNILKKRYSNMSNSKLIKYIIGKMFNMNNIKIIRWK